MPIKKVDPKIRRRMSGITTHFDIVLVMPFFLLSFTCVEMVVQSVDLQGFLLC